MTGDDLETMRGSLHGCAPDGRASLSAPIDIPWSALALGGIGLIAMSLVAFVIVTDERAASMQALTIIERTPPKRISAPAAQPPAASAESEPGAIARRTFRAGPPAAPVLSAPPAFAER